jgi:hypothetical protein
MDTFPELDFFLTELISLPTFVSSPPVITHLILQQQIRAMLDKPSCHKMLFRKMQTQSLFEPSAYNAKSP